MSAVYDETGFRVKSDEDYFADWEGDVFGYGYGTGEGYIFSALKTFFSCADKDESRIFEYQTLENALTPTVAWLLINRLCRKDILEYGTSPRYSWLTPEGNRLKAFVDSHTVEQMEEICSRTDGMEVCGRDYCNCGPLGYVEGRKCPNPFWPRRK